VLFSKYEHGGSRDTKLLTHFSWHHGSLEGKWRTEERGKEQLEEVRRHEIGETYA